MVMRVREKWCGDRMTHRLIEKVTNEGDPIEVLEFEFFDNSVRYRHTTCSFDGGQWQANERIEQVWSNREYLMLTGHIDR